MPTSSGNAGTVTVSGAGNVWDSPTNAQGATDGSFASSSHGAGSTQDLIASNFAISIPGTATVNGIALSVVKGGDGTQIRDLVIKLRKAVGAVGDNKADTSTDWTSGDETVGYGSSADLWGTTWTAAEVNASAFGVQLSANSTAPDTGPRVDSFAITVTYTDGGGGGGFDAATFPFPSSVPPRPRTTTTIAY